MRKQEVFCRGIDLSYRSYSAFWILAAPKKETYKKMTRTEAITAYKKMAWEDFDKQFKCDEEMQVKDERAIFLPHTEPNFLKRTFIKLEIVHEWKDNPAELHLTSLVYATPDGHPYSEAVHVKEYQTARHKRIIDAKNDLQKFYKNHRWRTSIGPLEIDPMETKKEELRNLDDVVLPTLMQVFKYGRNK